MQQFTQKQGPGWLNVVYRHISVIICWGAVWGATESHMTRSCAISALMGPFHRSDINHVTSGSHVTGRGPVWKYVLRMPGFVPCLFSQQQCKMQYSSTMATECDQRSCDPNVARGISHNASLYVIINNPDRWRYYFVIWQLHNQGLS